MRIPKLTVAAALGILLIFGALLTGLVATHEPNVRVGFEFVGHTNDSRNTRVAKFRVVNEGNRSIFRFGMYHLNTKQHPFDSTKPTNLFGLSPFRGRLLDAGQPETIVIPAVTNEGAWRAILRFENCGWRLRVRDK